MTNITYTSKAKEDLARINWKTREKIITVISNIEEEDPEEKGFRQMHNSELLKLTYDQHIIIGKYNEEQLNIITIQKKQQIRIPE